MKIYWIKAQAPRRVLALVKHLGAPAEFIDISRGLKTPDFAALNPNMKAPVLVDGETVLWESTAIMAHLCVRESCDMWPARHPQAQVTGVRRSRRSISSTSCGRISGSGRRTALR